ncbi:hypothetical protein [Brevibacillus brevis]|uniref:DUF4025 domain-containing protein n=1 Tax=Brevibacillus brevis TaxID=1393 RepID=A0ABY9SWY4_BREBE|nr:hypothetical protein [Brevibacillus brevis]WNC12109.1 hypothetical protein RGB73_15300 [Brevibacillus brevis]
MNSEDTKKQRDTNAIFKAGTDYVEALEQSSPAGASDEFGPDIGIPSNYEANQVGQKKSLSGFEVSRNIGRL